MGQFKCLIIGAGASGMAAACRLLERGFSNFRILEAENRIGGRVYTSQLDDEHVEIGAEWIHGEVDNAVYDLASKYDLADNSPSFTKFEETNFYESSGSQVNKDLSILLTKAFYEILSTDGKNLDPNVLKGSLGDYFDAEFRKKIDELSKKIKIDGRLCKKFIKTFENWENSIDASHSWYETSLCGHLEYWECEGNQLTRWKNQQYHTLFNLLSKKYPNQEQLEINDKIMFNKEVIKIKWNKECNIKIPNIEVECLDGSVYYADHVLVTCSLGVLKERAVKMFLPKLPEQKYKCIENLGFGTVDKIFVKFDRKWWGSDPSGFSFLWSEDERKNDSSGWLNGVICFHPISPTSLILRGWVTAETAQKMESLPHCEVVQGLNHLFSKFLGSSFQIPLIELCVISKWYSNPHFRGSYSCRLMKSESANVWASQLAEPICNVKGKPVVLFGGEATHDHYFSTVHGAVEAGRREADRLLSIVMEEIPIKKDYQVAIIGAGISGLSAAKTLFENGISDIIIVEAQSEPGGRIRSLRVEDYYLELGAQWIHGDKNEVFSICQKNNLITDEYSSEGEGLYLRENGDRIDEAIIREVDDVIKDILENCENYVSYQSKDKIPHSIGQELQTKFNEYLENCSGNSEEVKAIKKELFHWHVKFQLIDNSCSDLYNLSARAWGLFKFCGGNDYINFKNGYSSVIDTLVNSLPKNIILYNSCVTRIDWENEENIEEINFNQNHGSKIRCSNGLQINSQYVIVTSSLGYLKNNYKNMFYPPLPKYLSEAIDVLDFGVIDKIFLIYKKPWWDPKMKGFQLVWSDNEESNFQTCWGRYVTGFDVILKNKPVLLGWIGGEGAKIVEKMAEDQVGREATEILRYFTKNSEIPFPDKVVRTQWWCNEYVRGAYSHVTIKCDESEINSSNLTQPVWSTVRSKNKLSKKPVILLAGESTHKNHFSTVHGAFESGQSQAQVILDHIQSQNMTSD